MPTWGKRDNALPTIYLAELAKAQRIAESAHSWSPHTHRPPRRLQIYPPHRCPSHPRPRPRRPHNRNYRRLHLASW